MKNKNTDGVQIIPGDPIKGFLWKSLNYTLYFIVKFLKIIHVFLIKELHMQIPEDILQRLDLLNICFSAQRSAVEPPGRLCTHRFSIH
jgi:hypothetical protein